MVELYVCVVQEREREAWSYIETKYKADEEWANVAWDAGGEPPLVEAEIMKANLLVIRAPPGSHSSGGMGTGGSHTFLQTPRLPRFFGRSLSLHQAKRSSINFMPA